MTLLTVNRTPARQEHLGCLDGERKLSTKHIHCAGLLPAGDQVFQAPAASDCTLNGDLNETFHPQIAFVRVFNHSTWERSQEIALPHTVGVNRAIEVGSWK